MGNDGGFEHQIKSVFTVSRDSSSTHSNLPEDFEERRHRVHAVEEVHGNGDVQHRGPDAEAERLLLQSVVVLRTAAEGREDPQLNRERNSCG